MIGNLVVYGLSVTAATAVVVAFYKHKTLAAVKASAAKEVAYLESVAEKVATEVKADYTAAVKRLKALF